MKITLRMHSLLVLKFIYSILIFRHYIAYKLRPGEKIVFDGKLDEPVWNVEWTAKYAVSLSCYWLNRFQDIQGSKQPMPYYDTFAKMRYDDNFLYIGGLIMEPNAWANLTINNSIIFVDNDFEVRC
jgi:hypothetical protein